MLGVGERFPHFALMASLHADDAGAFQAITDKSHRGHWKLYFFWPKDFTELSLAEIIDFADLIPELHQHDTYLIGCSIESEFAHQAWRRQEVDLRDLDFPMLADIKRELCGELGILDAVEGVAQRATFLVDPDNLIRFVYVTDANVARDPGEVLRVLADLQGGPGG